MRQSMYEVWVIYTPYLGHDSLSAEEIFTSEAEAQYVCDEDNASMQKHVRIPESKICTLADWIQKQKDRANDLGNHLRWD